MLTGLVQCHGTHLLVPGLFPPVGFSMLLPVASETQSTIPTSLLDFVGNIFTLLMRMLCVVAKFTDEQYATINQSTAGRFDPRVFVNCLQVLVSS